MSCWKKLVFFKNSTFWFSGGLNFNSVSQITSAQNFLGKINVDLRNTHLTWSLSLSPFHLSSTIHMSVLIVQYLHYSTTEHFTKQPKTPNLSFPRGRAHKNLSPWLKRHWNPHIFKGERTETPSLSGSIVKGLVTTFNMLHVAKWTITYKLYCFTH